MTFSDSSPLSISVEVGPNVAVVRLCGSVTMDQADRLNAELRQVASAGVGRIVLDLSGLEFICSMGLGALIVAHVITQRNKGEVVLAGARPPIVEILTTTRLDRIFPLYPDVGSAIH